LNDFIEQLIAKLGLEPMPLEGGKFKRTYCSSDAILQSALPERYKTDKPFGTAIYYLLEPDQDSFSAMHRLLSDEVYHFYLGDPVEMLLLYPDLSYQQIILGSDILAGQQVQFVVSRGIWQGSHLRPGGRFALLGTTMAPGFTDDDFELGQRDELADQYPEAAILIKRLTRGE
jgi:hypothetical protein